MQWERDVLSGVQTWGSDGLVQSLQIKYKNNVELKSPIEMILCRPKLRRLVSIKDWPALPDSVSTFRNSFES